MTPEPADTPRDATHAEPEVSQSPERSRDVAVIIVNWNTRDLLSACLLSLQNALPERLAKVVVVDNASADGSAEMVRREFPTVTLAAQSSNLGYAGGNNLGIQQCGGARYLFLLNPDTSVDPGSLDALAAFLDVNERCGAVAPQLYGPDGVVQRSCRGFPAPVGLLAELMGLSRLGGLLPRLGAYRMHGWAHDSVRRVDQPMGSALMVRAAVVDQIGLMDPQFPLFFNEVDWLYRLHLGGWETWFTPEARVLHHHGSSTRQVRARAAWQSHVGLIRYYAKHYRRQLSPVLYAALIGVVLLRGILLTGLRLVQEKLTRR